MNGHTFHSSISSGEKFFVCNTTFKGEGKLKVNSGWFRTVSHDQTINVGSNLTVEIPNIWTGGLMLDAPMVVSNYVSHSNYTAGQSKLTVLGTYTPVDGGTNAFPNILLEDGATFDLSEMGTDSFDIVSKDNRTLSFATNATIQVKLGDRPVPANGKVVTWAEDRCPDNLNTLTFKIADEHSRYSIMKREGGLYLLSGFMIFIR